MSSNSFLAISTFMPGVLLFRSLLLPLSGWGRQGKTKFRTKIAVNLHSIIQVQKGTLAILGQR